MAGSDYMSCYLSTKTGLVKLVGKKDIELGKIIFYRLDEIPQKDVLENKDKTLKR
ncbi:hypothetical protein [Exiguobacterium sp. USCH10]|uniref:hypothetical protein n=1 Tax=Exiguobacterium sp. USCH10 TaxID=3024839 RepID=UPI00309859A4